jgi:molecular chaperone GrpE
MSVDDKSPSSPRRNNGESAQEAADAVARAESVQADSAGGARPPANRGSGDEPSPAERETVTETPESTIARLEQELAAKSAEVRQNHDRYLRERAELENFKKRMQKERAEAVRFASEQLIRDLLPVIDNLERAIEHADSGGNGQPLVEGVRLVWKSALDVLERHGVSRVEAAGRPFDPTQHEAIVQVPDSDREPNQVVQQFQAGYLLHQRLLRPAQVSVSTLPPVEKQGDDD